MREESLRLRHGKRAWVRCTCHPHRGHVRGKGPVSRPLCFGWDQHLVGPGICRRSVGDLGSCGSSGEVCGLHLNLNVVIQCFWFNAFREFELLRFSSRDLHVWSERICVVRLDAPLAEARGDSESQRSKKPLRVRVTCSGAFRTCECFLPNVQNSYWTGSLETQQRVEAHRFLHVQNSPPPEAMNWP